jgi:hypothetical protein
MPRALTPPHILAGVAAVAIGVGDTMTIIGVRVMVGVEVVTGTLVAVGREGVWVEVGEGEKVYVAVGETKVMVCA